MTYAVLKTTSPRAAPNLETTAYASRLLRALGACLLCAWLAGCVAPPTATTPGEGEPGQAAASRAKPTARPAPAPSRARGAEGRAVVPSAPASEIEPDEVPAAGDTGELLGRGLASWYGGRFHGRRTASGERFDREELTAAHRTLPFGARLCVRSMVNGKVVVVRVNDRGPFAPGRVIDLSQAAAQELGMTGLGIKPVELWRLGPEDDDCPEGLPELEAAMDDEVRASAPAPRPAVRQGRPDKAKARARRR